MDDMSLGVAIGFLCACIPLVMVAWTLFSALRHQLDAAYRAELYASQQWARACKAEALLAELRAKHFGRDASLWPAEHRPSLSESL